MTEDFHKARSDWGRIKHLILQRYIRLFVGKLGLYNKRIYYVDGFAGQGIYDDNEVGSAFIGAQTAAVPIQSSRAGVLKCINVEDDSETFKDLKKNLASQEADGHVRNLEGTFQQHLPEILKSIGTAPAFFFIDPFGSQGIEIETLKTIRKGRDRSEILVRYDDTRVKRLLSWAINNADNLKESHRKIAQGYAKRVNQLTDAEALKELDKAEGDCGLTRGILITGYMEAVKRIAGYKYALSYPIRNSRTGGHKYFLVHFCNHPDGYHYMANFMAVAERAYRESVRQSDDFFANPNATQEVMPGILEHADKAVEDTHVNELVNALPDILKRFTGSKEVENRLVYAAIVDRFGWKFTRKEWIRALRRTATNGLITFGKSEDGDLLGLHPDSTRLPALIA